MNKTCKKCQVAKPDECFYGHPKTKDKLFPTCKSCTREAGRKRYLNMTTEEKLNMVELAKKWKARTGWTPKPRALTEEQLIDRRKKKLAYYYKNQKRLISRQIEYNKKPEVKAKMSLRGRIRKLLAAKRPSIKTNELIGCSPSFLAKWLESKFKHGMTWANHGKWHIDHVIPCSSFNLKNPEHLRACFHYSNLQPLWARENMSKSDKLIPNTQPELVIPLPQ